MEQLCFWRAAFLCPQHPVHYGHKKRRRPRATFSSFIKQSSYTFIIVQIPSFIWNLDWPVTSKGIWGDLVQVHTVLLCWLPLVSILHQGGNTCNVSTAIRSATRSLHCLEILHWISECFDQKLSCYASPNTAECILQTLREQSSLCRLITPNH